MFYFITGGVRSGKSTYAETLATSLVKPLATIHYIATSVPYDEEMHKRVQLHQNQRQLQSQKYTTHEVPTDISSVFSSFAKGDVVLLDCLTTWLANELFTEKNSWTSLPYRKNVYQKIRATIKEVTKYPVTLIVVSNELFHDVPFSDKGTFYYQYLLGQIHQELIRFCTKAIVVEHGLPIVMKGGEND